MGPFVVLCCTCCVCATFTTFLVLFVLFSFLIYYGHDYTPDRCVIHDLPDTSIVFGHRGFTRYAQENTLEAVSAMTSSEVAATVPSFVQLLGAEFDVHLSSDGTLVTVHDEELHDLTGADDRHASDIRYEDLAAVNVAYHAARDIPYTPPPRRGRGVDNSRRDDDESSDDESSAGECDDECERDTWLLYANTVRGVGPYDTRRPLSFFEDSVSAMVKAGRPFYVDLKGDGSLRGGNVGREVALMLNGMQSSLLGTGVAGAVFARPGDTDDNATATPTPPTANLGGGRGVRLIVLASSNAFVTRDAWDHLSPALRAISVSGLYFGSAGSDIFPVGLNLRLRLSQKFARANYIEIPAALFAGQASTVRDMVRDGTCVGAFGLAAGDLSLLGPARPGAVDAGSRGAASSPPLVSPGGGVGPTQEQAQVQSASTGADRAGGAGTGASRPSPTGGRGGTRAFDVPTAQGQALAEATAWIHTVEIDYFPPTVLPADDTDDGKSGVTYELLVAGHIVSLVLMVLSGAWCCIGGAAACAICAIAVRRRRKRLHPQFVDVVPSPARDTPVVSMWPPPLHELPAVLCTRVCVHPALALPMPAVHPAAAPALPPINLENSVVSTHSHEHRIFGW
eukprot:TRINITY_DN68861_c0_g1_i1.p1 TRINITY_DN68861_c0_g1~~TRINITY_DN68861_c0_g1_i1.p1  ORF type:complete len:623 (+),score=109.63 TRINITY_DN68861_c0_g1_i1:228-2096(+)